MWHRELPKMKEEVVVVTLWRVVRLTSDDTIDLHNDALGSANRSSQRA